MSRFSMCMLLLQILVLLTLAHDGSSKRQTVNGSQGKLGETREYACEYNYAEYNGWCYRLYLTPLSNYEEALETCRNEGADLVSIHNAFANVYVQNLNKGGVLIGLRYDQTKQMYEWSDGSALDFTSYADGFVDYRDYFGYCAKNVQGKWTNLECVADKSAFACMQKAAIVDVTPNRQCPNASAVYWNPGTILSPGYPQPYDLDSPSLSKGCFYKLLAKNEQIINIKFEEMALEDDKGSIVVYKSWTNEGEEEILKATNAFAGAIVTVDYNRALLHFNGSSRGKWRIFWTAEDQSSGASPNDICPNSEMIYTESKTILSPGYPKQFEFSPTTSATGCTYMLFADGNVYIILLLEEIRLEDNNGWIDVYEGWDSSAQKIASVDNREQGQHVVIRNNKALIHVYGSSAGTFVIKWYKEEACKEGWTIHNNACYYKGPVVDQPAASKFCISQDATLVSIESAEEEKFVERFVSTRDVFHIGLVKPIDSESWYWLDGSPVTYLNWGAGEPNFDCDPVLGHCCAVGNYYWVADVSTWNDQSCTGSTRSYQFVCKRKLIK